MQVRDTAFRQTVTTLTSRVDGCQQQENSTYDGQRLFPVVTLSNSRARRAPSHANGTLPALFVLWNLTSIRPRHSVEDGSFREIVAGLRELLRCGKSAPQHQGRARRARISGKRR